MQELNEKNEKKGFDNLYQVFTDILPKCLNYKIVPKDPVSENDKWKVQLNLSFIFNKNYDILKDYIFQFVKSISMSDEEVTSYKALKKHVYILKLQRNETSFERVDQSLLVVDTFYLRNESTYKSVISFPYSILKFIISNYIVDNGLIKNNLINCMIKCESEENCKFYLDSKAPFYRYLDLYSESQKKFTWDKTTGIFLNASGNLVYNASPTYVDFHNSVDVDNDGEFNKIATLKCFDWKYPIYNNWFKDDLISKIEVPGSPIFNLHGHSNQDFLNINFSEYFTIEEIKKITEYKVMIN